MGLYPAIQKLLLKYPQLESLKPALIEALETMLSCNKRGGKILVCGNGGSGADAQHMAGELMKSFEKERPLNPVLKKQLVTAFPDKGPVLSEQLQAGIPAISLASNQALASAISNDMGADLVFAQELMSIGYPADVLIGFSTSGNSENVINAMLVARSLKIKTIGFTGKSGGRLGDVSEILLNVPEQRTADIQELHVPVYHALCRDLELALFPED